MDQTRRLFMGGVTAGVVTAAAGAAAAPAARAAAPARTELGWHNVLSYGAKGDGAADDTPFIQAALDACEPGNTVYLPAGLYRTSRPVRIPPRVTLQGSHGGGEHEYEGRETPPVAIKPLPGFTGEAVLLILDRQLGGYPRKAVEQRVFRLTVDGSALDPEGPAVDGIRAVGQIQHLQLRDVQIHRVTGIGVNTTYNTGTSGPQAPFCLHFDRVSIMWSKSFGVALNNTTDSVFTDVYALGCDGAGWWISGAGNSTFTGCRAEWSRGEGFWLNGWKGVIQFTGCSTDRSGRDGILVQNDDVGSILQLSGCRLDRDGRNVQADGTETGGGGLAGLRVVGSKAKVLADGLIVLPGRDDKGGSVSSPMFGVSATDSVCTVVTSGFVDGVERDWHDGGGNGVFLKGPTLLTSTEG
ncbi:right-handed parallel beta-helix repeat-containing protein [Streptomyces sp. ISL-43]|uniref:right-handed parallel beta-helix repeat-containing protein n=1 Tax=Streptomyces sp. ISL-43 TaxID=2819183 RepID=UPI001BE8780C|nr:right-handed parallel beta-helix repeat-containing protein [Streptomyces sp. ISL-43]MBT2448695.1 right-handed parallel beta-helix repeat-containing protein [Streptomyces sp. ISL-43]